MDLYRNTLIDLPSDRLLQRRALAVAAFKARVDTAGMTRSVRADEERACLESVGAESVFLERLDVMAHDDTPRAIG